MLTITLLLGAYSYTIYFLGLSGLLTKNILGYATIFFLAIVIFKIAVNRHKFLKFILSLQNLTFFEKSIIVILGLNIFINMIGALGPELGFDALWYHLTIPKIFINNSSVFFIEDSIFYYSLLPKIIEMQYAAILLFSSEIAAKMIHFLYGLLACYLVYIFSRRYLSRFYSLLAVTLFYTNLVISWQSITAYVDLARAFFEIYAFYYLFNFIEKRKIKNLLISSTLFGLAVGVKIVSLITLPAFIVMILVLKQKFKYKLKYIFINIIIIFVLLLPWFIYSFISTSNPIYPLFSNYAPNSLNLNIFNPDIFLKNFIQIFIFSADPISPLYLISLPFLIINWRQLAKIRKLIYFLIISLFVWYLAAFLGIWHATDRAGGARFLIPYLSIFSIIIVYAIKKSKDKLITNFLIVLILLTALINIFYRGLANFKYLPYILHMQSKQDFLMKNLNFGYGDFYDENKKIAELVKNKTVLLINMHNLFYVDFNYTLNDRNGNFDYILVQNSDMPSKYLGYKLIYENKRTVIKLYKK